MQTIREDYPDLDIEYVNVGAREINHPDPDLCVLGFDDACQKITELQSHCPYGTVVVDSFTSLSNTAVTFQLMARLGGRFDLKNVKKTKGGLPTAGFDEFNGETTVISLMLDVFKVLPCNVVWTAHPIPKTETNKEGEVTKRYHTIAAYGHKVDKIVPGYFTEIWRFEYNVSAIPGQKPSYKIYTVPGAEGVGSTALGLPGEIDVTDKNLWEVIQNELKAKTNRQNLQNLLNQNKNK